VITRILTISAAARRARCCLRPRHGRPLPPRRPRHDSHRTSIELGAVAARAAGGVQALASLTAPTSAP